MKKFYLTLSQKLWLTISLAIILTIIFSYGLTYFLYWNLYVNEVESNLQYQGNQLIKQYSGGEVSGEFTDKVNFFNEISETEIFLVENPRELSACLPFEIDYDSLISGDERQQLLEGEVISKLGYEPRFDRSIISVIIPILDEERLMGIIYMYMPLATINEAFNEVRQFLYIGGFLFFIATLFVGRMIVLKITKSLKQMETSAEQLALGNFKEKITVSSNDEIGRLGEAFNKMSSALEEVDNKRKEFLANVSHELRTPLSYIKGYSEAMIDGVVKTEKQKADYTKLINREASRMERLVGDLLDLAQLESDSYPLKKVPLAFAQQIEDTVLKYEHILSQKEIGLKLDLDPDIIIMGDADRLEQVIHNIMDNSIRYSETGDCITVALTQQEQFCRLSISDQGIGIPKEELEHIGERFFRVDKARSRQHGGTGIGLSIVKQIINRHEGRFSIESELGQGTTVHIDLPLLPEEDDNQMH